jgi:hypothetical protein
LLTKMRHVMRFFYVWILWNCVFKFTVTNM